jgi:thiamine-phosphate pyrophosphorylase
MPESARRRRPKTCLDRDLAALVGDISVPGPLLPLMPLPPQNSPRCSLYLVTPLLSVADADAFVGIFASALEAAPIACALVRLAPRAEAHAKAIVTPLVRPARDTDCALLIENDARLAARLGADGVHVAGAGEDLVEAMKSLKPERIVGAGSLRTRDEAMSAGEMGTDYVMFGEPHAGAQAMGLASLMSLTERVAWWAEIFETPCVAFAETIEAAGTLADAGADFVALGDAVWASASPAAAVREAQARITRVGAGVP